METPPLPRTKRRDKRSLPPGKSNSISMSSMMLQHPASSHIFIGVNKIIRINPNTGDSSEWNFSRVPRASRKVLWEAIKNHHSKPIFWLLPSSDEAREGFGSLHQIDPTPIINFPNDLNNPKIMLLALNPKWSSPISKGFFPKSVANICLYCKEIFISSNSRQRYCPDKDCQQKAEIKRKKERRRSKRLTNEIGERIPEKKCKNCSTKINGRSDIVFCSDRCRIAYNRKNNKQKII